VDFFGAQDDARRNSRWLIGLFLLAVLAIIGVVYLVLIGYFQLHTAELLVNGRMSWWDAERFGWVALSVGGLVGAGSLYRIRQLSHGGGRAVAATLGGAPVARDTADRLERRLLNVVDEMAIASGVPVPSVYVLANEPGINAFAAGHSTNDAVVAVTRGALERLSRDELQGVVAHEFSHIFHGDMRINLRLMGLLHGILLIALLGRWAIYAPTRRYRTSRGGGAGFVFLGLTLLIVGYIGVFFGRLLKAAVSRQREYLADASAVRYTRNPAGIAGALKKIAGLEDTRVGHPGAEEASHLFFGQGVRHLFNLLATHPPIAERITRLDPAFRMEAAVAGTAAAETGPPGAAGFAARPEAVRASVGTSDERHLAYAREVLGRIPAEVAAELPDPYGAEAVLYALIAAFQADPEAALTANLDPDSAARAQALIGPVQQAGTPIRLPLVEKALPALEALNPQQVRHLQERLAAVVRHDGRLSPFEFAVTALLEHTLLERRSHHGAATPKPRTIRSDVTVLLSMLAHAGHRDEGSADAAFREATKRVPLEATWQLLPRDALSGGALERALARLDGLKYRFKGQLIEACVAAVTADGKVTVTEAELLRAVGARLDCPVPPMLPGEVQ